MIVVARLRPTSSAETAFRAEVAGAVDAFAARPGFVAARLARALDEPSLWVLLLEFDGVGNYRRALSSYDVKMASGVLMGAVIDEPTAYEEVPPGGVAEQA